MKKRKGMNIYRLERLDKVIEGDAVDLEFMGIDATQVRAALTNGKTYLGYTISIIGKVEKVEKKKRKLDVESFNSYALMEHKTYGQLQQEETLGRIIV